jgi:peptide/nickel transport system substrate-binding protein
VKFSLEYKGRHVPSRRWIEKTLSRAVIGPDNTVVLTFKKPYTRLDTEFTSLRIFPGHIWEEVEEPQYHPPAGQYVGYGPFIIRETDANAGVVLFHRNPFWKGKKPGISRIEIQIYQNLDVLGLALEKGDIDTFYQYANSYPYANLSRLAASGDFNLVENRSSGLILLGFNLQREPVSHSWFRLAVSYAIDYKEILKLIASGYGEVPRRGFVPVNMPYFQETPRLEQDFHKAREILRQHGCKSADREALLLLSTPPHLRLCELIKDYLAGAGIAVEVKVVDSATWFSMKERYDYDLIITNTTPWGMRMHANWGTGYFDSRRSGEGVLHTLPDPVFLKLCDDILSTRDTVRLQGYARQLQDYYREQIPALALLWKTNVTPFNKSFAGWHADPLFGTFNVANFLDLRRVDAGP